MRIGVDLGGANIHIGVISDGQVLKKISEPVQVKNTENESIEHLIKTTRKAMNSNIRGIGVGISSKVDAERGVVYNVTSIPSWKEVYLKDVLEQEFNVPVTVNNDSNCFAIGEHRFGRAASFRDIVCISAGSVVNAGIIINGQLYGGNNTYAGEIGKMPYLDRNFNFYCGEHFFNYHKLSLSEALGKAKGDDTNTMALWEEYGKHMGYLISTMLFAYDPQALIIGGSISKGYDYFIRSVNQVLNSFPHQSAVKRLRIMQSQREDITLLGAGALVE